MVLPYKRQSTGTHIYNFTCDNQKTIYVVPPRVMFFPTKCLVYTHAVMNKGTSVLWLA